MARATGTLTGLLASPWLAAYGWISEKLRLGISSSGPTMGAKWNSKNLTFYNTSSKMAADRKAANWLMGGMAGTLLGNVVGGAVDAEKVCVKYGELVQNADTFDLETFISAPWYAQWQLPTFDQPLDAMNCSMIEFYKKCGNIAGGQRACKREDWTLDVSFRGKRPGTKPGVPVTIRDTKGELCAKQSHGAELEFAQCFLLGLHVHPPLWIFMYNEAEGYAVVMEGQPDMPMQTGTCSYYKTPSRGMWIVTRQRHPSHAITYDIMSTLNSVYKIDKEHFEPVNQYAECSDLDGL